MLATHGCPLGDGIELGLLKKTIKGPIVLAFGKLQRGLLEKAFTISLLTNKRVV